MSTPDPRPLEESHWADRLTALATQHGVPGAQLGILRLGAEPSADVIARAAHGVLNATTGHPVTVDSVFQIGSITKVWTATVVMQLVDAGDFELDTPVRELLPDLRLQDERTAAGLTIRHLLTHTSGIDGDVFTDTGRGDDALENYADLLAQAVQTHPLGATWSYCNSGYVLLGRVIEAVTGTSWDTAMRERLLEPLALERTSTLPEEALVQAVALGHLTGMPDPVPAPVWGLPRSMGPAGLITAPVRDVLEFARLHLRHGLTAEGTRLLSAGSAEAMASNQVVLPDPHTLGDSWGLSWIRFDWNGRRALGHDGATIGQNAFLRLLPDAGLAVALLTNGGQAQELHLELSREIFSELAGAAIPAPLSPPAEPVGIDVSPHLGCYRGAAIQLDVMLRDEDPVLRTTLLGPMASLDPEPVHEYRLAAIRDGLYAVRLDDSRTWTPVTFYTVPDGRRYAHFGARALPHVPQ